MTTPKILLPELSNGAGNYLLANQTFNAIDQAIQLRVVDKDLAAPPGSPTNGAAYIVAASPTGAWAGKATQIAYWITAVGAWQFLAPANGWLAWVTDENKHYRLEAGAWVELTTGGSTLPVVRAITANENLALANINTFGFNSTASNYTSTIPAQSTVAWTADAEMSFKAASTGTITITAATGVTLNGVLAGSLTLYAGAAGSIKRKSSDVWEAVGTFGTTAEQRTALGLGTGSSPTFTALTLSNGQISFPATQVPSANANTLDDYEEGTWTPVLTFATPGDLSVVYSVQTGIYTKIGNRVIADFVISTSTFTHTTASGNMQITGLPFTPSAGNSHGAFSWQGITKVNYTDISTVPITGATRMEARAAGSGQARSAVTAADMPTGGSVQFIGQVIYSV